MKKWMYAVCMVAVISGALLLTGCGKKQPVEATISFAQCRTKEHYDGSERGKTILYYYDNGKEVSIYFSGNLNSNFVSLRKYFVDKELYELEKKSSKWDRTNDSDLVLYKRTAVTFEDKDAFYDQIENSPVYTLVK